METLLCADLHFGHRNIITFCDDSGKIGRPFSSIEEHDETLIHNWNKAVNPNDRVFIGGDVTINKKYIPVVERLNGKKFLIFGNHDNGKIETYMQYFDGVMAYKQFSRFIISHIPIHISQVDRFKVNVHGHTHQSIIDDPRYICVSMEQINFTPIHLDEIIKEIDRRGL